MNPFVVSAVSTSNIAMDDQLITRFKRTGYKLDARELELKCVSLAQQFDLTAEQFALAFEAFALNR